MKFYIISKLYRLNYYNFNYQHIILLFFFSLILFDLIFYNNISLYNLIIQGAPKSEETIYFVNNKLWEGSKSPYIYNGKHWYDPANPWIYDASNFELFNLMLGSDFTYYPLDDRRYVIYKVIAHWPMLEGIWDDPLVIEGSFFDYSKKHGLNSLQDYYINPRLLEYLKNNE